MLTPLVEKSVPNIVSTYLFIICGVTIFVLYLQMLWKNRRLYWYSYKTPGPIGLPFIGIGYKFITRDLSVMLQRWVDIQTAYPQVAAVWFGPRLYYLIAKPEYVQKVLSSQSALNKDYLYEFVNDITGEGLLTVGGKKWKKHRRTIMPAFNQKILDSYQNIFCKKAEIFINELQKEVGNKNLELHHLISSCTLDIICETALGTNMNVQTTKQLEFINAMNKALEIISIRSMHVWHQLKFTWRFFPISREYYKALDLFHEFVYAVISKKMKDFENNSTKRRSSVDNDIVSAVKEESCDGIAFLDLIYTNSKFSEREIIDEVKTFIIAGTDTTASALTFVFTMLGLFQNVQQKVLEEITDILGPERRPFPVDLLQMKYTERVIKETLRLFPVAPLYLRTLNEDIDGGDMVFPGGSSVAIGPVFIHRNPEHWPDPLKFDPDRFLPENIAKRHPCTYIPFSYGPRNCIGGKYGMINMKTILAYVLRRYKIFTKYKSIEEIKLSTNMVLRLKDGPKVWIEHR
ncbi:cytochrome P450 4C1-like [Diabrotica undecimpunctata]|uniref:cytochrome P450 4C1-like n=1 Tax=Diabrotica undecimpunctata TaxID=50387 RepID=UPI003B63F4A3